MENKIIFYCDGGSRGNPGHAALGVVIATSDKRQVIKEYSEYLGKTTNNEAEYRALIFGMKKIKHLIGKEKAKQSEIEARMDSELIVNQLNGEYKIKEPNLQQFFIEVWNLKQDFKKVDFIHVPREENTRADALVNRELDRKQEGFI